MADNDFDKTMKLPASGKAPSADSTGKMDVDKTMKLNASGEADKTMKLNAAAPAAPKAQAPQPPAMQPPKPAARSGGKPMVKIAVIMVPVVILLLAGAWVFMPGSLKKTAEKASQAGNHAKAASALQTALKLKPLHAETYLVPLGRELRLSNDYTGAQKALEQALQAKPDALDAQRELGQTYLDSGQKQKAFDAFQKVLQVQPEDSEVLRWSAKLAFDLKDYPNAATSYEKLAKSGGGGADDWLQLGMAYLEMNKTAEAENALVVASEKNKDLKSVTPLLAKIYLAQQRYLDAATLYKKAMAATPNDPALSQTYADICQQAATAFIAQNKPQDAILFLREALTVSVQSAPSIRYQIAQLWAKQKKNKETLDALAASLKGDPTLKAKALRDPAFAALRKHPLFRKITR